MQARGLELIAIVVIDLVTVPVAFLDQLEAAQISLSAPAVSSVMPSLSTTQVPAIKKIGWSFPASKPHSFMLLPPAATRRHGAGVRP